MRSLASYVLVAALASASLGLLVMCVGGDPDQVRECDRDDQCGAGRRCDVGAGKCVPVSGDEAGIDAGEGGTEQKVIVLGQPDEFSNLLSELGIETPLSVAVNAGRLAVADYRGERVLVWNAIPTTNLKRPDVVVGKPSLKLTTSGSVSAQNFDFGQYCDPMGLAAGRLFVTDTRRHRALVWNVLPTTDYRAADTVVAAPDFTTAQPVQQPPPAASASTLANPCSMASDGTRLFVADHSNNRVLIWSTIPTTNGKPADAVLGKADLTSGGADPGDCLAPEPRACFASPSSIFSDGTRLWVADNQHHRVLQWNAIPTGQTPADVILGQTSSTGFGANAGGRSASSLSSPRGVFAAGGKLFIADEENHRVLIWNSIPTTDGQPADVVVGQPDFTSGDALHGGTRPDAKSLASPHGITTDGTRLFVTDSGSGRVLVWNAIPTANFAPADVVLGRPSLTSTQVREPDAKTYEARVAFTDGKRFFVSELSRILVWDHVPTGPNDPATLVLGHDTFDKVSGRLDPPAQSDKRFHVVQAIWADATRVVASDTFNHRVLIWNKALASNNQAADVVLGQTDFAATQPHGGPAGGAATASGFSLPQGVVSDGTRLAVADMNNHRVLVWNTFPSSNNQPADMVLGQADVTQKSANRGGVPGADTLNQPSGLYFDGTSFFVVDAGNNRVLGWKGWPATGRAADVVFGQPDFAAGAPNNGGISAKTLNGPGGVVVVDGRIYIGDRLNHRVLRWDRFPPDNGHAADGVYGQPDFKTSEPNNGGLGPRSLAEPSVSATSPGRLWVGDSLNVRVLGLPVP